MNADEEWRPVPDWPEYEVSSHGRIRSLSRIVEYKDGRKRFHTGIILRQSTDKRGYFRVSIYRPGVHKAGTLVHHLITAAFIGTRPPELVTRHKDGNQANNRADNLCFGTHTENMQDLVRHGKNHNVNKKVCPRKHQLSGANLMPSVLRKGYRGCLSCNRAHGFLRKNPGLDMQAVADRYYAALQVRTVA